MADLHSELTTNFNTQTVGLKPGMVWLNLYISDMTQLREIGQLCEAIRQATCVGPYHATTNFAHATVCSDVPNNLCMNGKFWRLVIISESNFELSVVFRWRFVTINKTYKFRRAFWYIWVQVNPMNHNNWLKDRHEYWIELVATETSITYQGVHDW